MESVGIGPMNPLIPLIGGAMTSGTPTTGSLFNPASATPTDSISFSGGFSRRNDGPTLESFGLGMGRCEKSSCNSAFPSRNSVDHLMQQVKKLDY